MAISTVPYHDQVSVIYDIVSFAILNNIIALSINRSKAILYYIVVILAFGFEKCRRENSTDGNSQEINWIRNPRGKCKLLMVKKKNRTRSINTKQILKPKNSYQIYTISNFVKLRQNITWADDFLHVCFARPEKKPQLTKQIIWMFLQSQICSFILHIFT